MSEREKLAIEALEKISGARDYTGEDYAVSAHYKSDEGLWTVDEYLADVALAALRASPDAPEAEGGEVERAAASIRRAAQEPPFVFCDKICTHAPCICSEVFAKAALSARPATIERLRGVAEEIAFQLETHGRITSNPKLTAVTIRLALTAAEQSKPEGDQ